MIPDWGRRLLSITILSSVDFYAYLRLLIQEFFQRLGQSQGGFGRLIAI